jgi:hypothetical protein
MSLIIVDCEAMGPCPRKGELTEFGAVDFSHYFRTGEWETFHGKLAEAEIDPENPAIRKTITKRFNAIEVFRQFNNWLESQKGRSIFISDNPAWDFQWIHDGFHVYLGENPFGHSGRRISDFYAGLRCDFSKTQEWKARRITPHDHNPVHDAMGNAEAFKWMLQTIDIADLKNLGPHRLFE